MQRKEKENIQKKDNSSDDEYFSEGNDDDYFVDNLKHFFNVTQ